MLNLEQLEDRNCPTTLSMKAGVLTITADSGSSQVRISESVKNNAVEVSYGTLGGTLQTKTVHNVTQIVFQGSQGTDWYVNDTLVPDVVNGEGGGDVLVGSLGDSSALFGGEGNDVLLGRAVNLYLSGGPGVNYIYIPDSTRGPITIVPGEQDFVITPVVLV